MEVVGPMLVVVVMTQCGVEGWLMGCRLVVTQRLVVNKFKFKEKKENSPMPPVRGPLSPATIIIIVMTVVVVHGEASGVRAANH